MCIRDRGYPVQERLITAQELFDAAAEGKLEEAWGTGTAAVEMCIRDRVEHQVAAGNFLLQYGPLPPRGAP